MRANILHTLIIAMLLIVGWTVFTLLQDFVTPNPEGYSKMALLNKTSQYLPIVPEKTYDIKRDVPQYKPVASRGGKSSGGSAYVAPVNEINTSQSVLSQSQLSINQGKSSVSNVDVKQKTGISGSNPSGNVQMAVPFSKTSGVSQPGMLAMNNVKPTSEAGMSASGSGGMRKAFGDDEGDPIEGGGGDENEDYYNDMPVGDGMHILLLLALVYIIFKFFKKS
jgi:hypothetical protein